jgi:ribonuclease Z
MQAPTAARWPLRHGAAARPWMMALRRPPAVLAAATASGSSAAAARRLGLGGNGSSNGAAPQRQPPQKQQQQQPSQQHPQQRDHSGAAGSSPRSWQQQQQQQGNNNNTNDNRRSRSRSRSRRRAPMMGSPAAPPPPLQLQLPPSSAPRLPEAVDWSALPTGLAVTWLGTSSGAPSLHRNISCTVLRHRRGSAAAAAATGAAPPAIASPPPPTNAFIVDAGEGSARQLSRTGVDLSGVQAVLITHLHGDHCFGLGSLVAACLSARRAAAAAAAATAGGGAEQASAAEPLLVVGPPGVHDLVAAQLLATGLMRALLPSASSPPQPLLRVVELVELPGDAADASPACSWRKHQAACALAGSSSASAVLFERLPPRRGEQPDAELRARLRGSSLVPPEQRRMFQQQGNHYHNNHNHGHQNHQQQPAVGALDADAGNGARPPPYTAKPGLVWPLPVPAGCGARVTAAQLQHRVPCWGYVWEEGVREEDEQGQQRRARGLLRATAAASNGNSSSRRGRKVVLLGDTVDSAALAPLALGADLVAHEATFARGMEGKAALAQHSTARMAGSFARAVGARRLVLTHFSARYDQAAVGVGGGGEQHQQQQQGLGAGAAPQDDEERAQRVAIDALRLEAAQAMVGAGGGGSGGGGGAWGTAQQTRRPRPFAHVEAAHDFWTAHVAAAADEEEEEEEKEEAMGSMR